MLMRLSVILPVRNGQNYLSQALACLDSQLGNEDELIVIDDGSQDGTCGILESFKPNFMHLRILNGAGAGPAAARNMGLAVAKGRYVSFLDHDDLWTDGRLARHTTFLEQNPQVDAVVGKTAYEYVDTMAARQILFKNGTSALHHVHLGATTLRSSVFSKVGSFNADMNFSEDHEFFLRLREQGVTMYFDPEASLRYRVHGDNMSLDKSLQELGVFKVLADSIRRRRNQGKLCKLTPFGENKDS